MIASQSSSSKASLMETVKQGQSNPRRGAVCSDSAAVACVWFMMIRPPRGASVAVSFCLH